MTGIESIHKDADTVIRLVKELLNRVGEKMDTDCNCETCKAVVEFAVKIIKLGIIIEDNKIQELMEDLGL